MVCYCRKIKKLIGFISINFTISIINFKWYIFLIIFSPVLKETTCSKYFCTESWRIGFIVLAEANISLADLRDICSEHNIRFICRADQADEQSSEVRADWQ